MRVRFVVISLMSIFAFAAVPAHEIEVASSEPGKGETLAASPSRVRLEFEEELQTQESTVGVFNSAGEQVDAGDGGVDLEDPDHASLVASLPPLPDGVYTVRWEALLLDGDRSAGEYVFYVGIQPGEAGGTSAEDSPAGGLSPAWFAAGALVVILAAAGVGFLSRRRNTRAG